MTKGAFLQDSCFVTLGEILTLERPGETITFEPTHKYKNCFDRDSQSSGKCLDMTE